MIAFVCGLVLPAGGYVFYGRLTSSTVRPDPARPVGVAVAGHGGDLRDLAVLRLGQLPKLEPEADKPAVTAQPTEAERAGDSLAC